MIALIAALDRNFAIGKGGAMPWHLPDDLKRFKKLTMGNPVLMGRKTAQSIGRALPGRLNLVLSRHGFTPFGQPVASINEALELINERDLMVIGGGEIYREVYETVRPLVSRLHLTWVDTETPDADAFFPSEIGPDNLLRWKVTAREHHPADANHTHAFEFVDYEKVS